MNTSMEAIDADDLEDMMPNDDWWAENDGPQCVYAYADDMEDPGLVPASVTIEHFRGSLWKAEWCVPDPTKNGLHSADESIVACLERAVEWAVSKAEEMEDD